MKWKFKAEIRRSIDKQFYHVLVPKNGNDYSVGETCKRKHGVIKALNNNFPGVQIIDTTKTKN